MSKLTIIQLLNKIAKGEEMPKKIRIDHWCYNFEWVKHIDNYYDEQADIDLTSALSLDKEELNYEVKVIEEETKPITKESIEALGYACGEIQKCFTNGWNKSLENKPLREDKKIENVPLSYIVCKSDFEDMHIVDVLNNFFQVNDAIINELIDKVNNMENNQ